MKTTGKFTPQHWSKRSPIILSAAALMLLAGASGTQAYTPQYGADAGVYLPTSSTVKNLLGSTWYSISPAFGAIGYDTNKGSVGIDLSVLFNSHDGNHVLLAPVGLKYTQGIGSPGDTIYPYFSVAGDAAIVSVDIPNSTISNSTTVVPSGEALLGLSFGDRAFLEAGYRAVGSTKGLSFSGGEANVGIRF